MSQPFGKGQGPWVPSNLKENEYRIDAVETAQPTTRNKGITVQRWREVIFSFHGIDPDIDDAGAVGWQLTFKVWRFKLKAREGTARPAGQWYAQEEITVSMDGDVSAGGPMEVQLPTWNSEKMYLQPVASLEGPDTWEAMVTCYGHVPRFTAEGEPCDCQATSSGGSGTGGGIVVANMFDLLAHENYTYSNQRGDFDAIRTTGTTITLSKLPYALEERQILAIGLKRTGSATRTRMWYRDDGLRVDYDQATGVITVDGFTINSNDAISVWLEGPPKIDDPLAQARRVLAMNPDSKMVTHDGNILRTLEEGGSVEEIELNMAQDGLHWLSLHHNNTGDAFVVIYGTNDLSREGGERWDDITEKLTGFSQIDTNVPDVVTMQAWCGYRRIKLELNPGTTGGNVDLLLMRSAYGGVHNPIAHEDFPALDDGRQIMGQARAVQAAAIDEDDAGTLAMNLYKELVLANYIWPTQANRTEEDDPLDTRDATNVLAEVTGQGDGTYDYYLDMAHFTKVGIQIENVDGVAGDNTYTIWGSEQDDGTAPNAVAYQNITQFGCDSMTSANAASYTADVLLQTNAAGLSYKWIRVRVERANDGDNDDGEWTIYARPLYH